MIEKTTIETLLKSAFAHSQIVVTDLTGTRDHYKVVIISDLFVGKSRVQRQQMVNQALAEPLKGPLHALTMETLTITEAKQRETDKPTPRGINF
jgi:BolA protein